MAFLSRWPKSHVALIWLGKEATGSRGRAKVLARSPDGA